MTDTEGKASDIAEIVMSKSPLALVVLNYELILRNLREARTVPEENGERRGAFIAKAREFLLLLMESLDTRFEISGDLLRLYLYVNTLLIRAGQRGEREPVCESCDIISSLLDSWRALERAEAEQSRTMAPEPLSLTAFAYKGGKLCEITLAGEGRGIKA